MKTDTEHHKQIKKRKKKDPTNGNKSNGSNNVNSTGFTGEDKKIIAKLTQENNELKKNALALMGEDLNNSIVINKLKAEKFIIFSELNELIHALKQVDIKKLDKFFELNSKLNKGFSKKSLIPVSMGISYNIMSAQNQLGLISQSDLVSSQLNLELEKIKKISSNMQEKAKPLESENNNPNPNNQSPQAISGSQITQGRNIGSSIQEISNNCCSILKNYEADFELAVNKVLGKFKPQQSCFDSV